MKRLAIITTHPIQYNAPLFAMLKARGKITIKVFYTWGEEVLQRKYDPGFNKAIEWDIPLLEGYDYAFVNNRARNKGSHHFFGVDNPTLITDIQHWKAEAILLYGWSFKSHLRVMRYFSGRLPVFFRGDSISINRAPGIKAGLRSLVLKWVYEHVDVAFYVGTHNKNYFLQSGLRPSQLIFAPHAIDNARFGAVVEGCDDEIQQWRSSLGIAAEAEVFLYAGKMDRNKNVGLLLETFVSLDKRGAHLIIAGDGDLKEELTRKYSVFRNIHFLPFQNQSKMPLLYGIADVYVLPSLSETWGLAINEAMACGKAILASSNCGAAIDLVQDNVNGFVFHSNNGNDLLDKLKQLSGNTSALKEMGQRSRQIIDKWNYENTCVEIEQTLNSIK